MLGRRSARAHARRGSSFDCTSPREFGGRPIRCRKCSGCRELSLWLKSCRIDLETMGHDRRVWLVTLTFRDSVLADLPAAADPVAQEKAAYKHVQKWLRLVRQDYRRRTGVSKTFRYTCVAELGSLNRRLHYHIIVYSNDDLRKRDLEVWWHKNCGHANARLSDGRKARKYITKYMLKGPFKLRSSSKLGSEFMDKVYADAGVDAALRAFPGAKVHSVGPITPGLWDPDATDEDRARSAEWRSRVRVPREMGGATRAPEVLHPGSPWSSVEALLKDRGFVQVSPGVWQPGDARAVSLPGWFGSRQEVRDAWDEAASSWSVSEDEWLSDGPLVPGLSEDEWLSDEPLLPGLPVPSAYLDAVLKAARSAASVGLDPFEAGCLSPSVPVDDADDPSCPRPDHDPRPSSQRRLYMPLDADQEAVLRGLVSRTLSVDADRVRWNALAREVNSDMARRHFEANPAPRCSRQRSVASSSDASASVLRPDLARAWREAKGFDVDDFGSAEGSDPGASHD